MAENAHLVYDHSLQWRHDGSADDCHDEECCSEAGVLVVYMLEGYPIDGGEHQRHEDTDAYKAVEACHAHDADSSEGAYSGPESEDGKQLSGIDKLHQGRCEESPAEEEHHGYDVIHLRRGLIDTKIVGILNDERPYHNLCGDIEHLCENALAVGWIVP